MSKPDKKVKPENNVLKTKPIGKLHEKYQFDKKVKKNPKQKVKTKASNTPKGPK